MCSGICGSKDQHGKAWASPEEQAGGQGRQLIVQKIPKLRLLTGEGWSSCVKKVSIYIDIVVRNIHNHNIYVMGFGHLNNASET